MQLTIVNATAFFTFYKNYFFTQSVENIVFYILTSFLSRVNYEFTTVEYTFHYKLHVSYLNG